MPAFSARVADLEAEGPILDVYIAVSPDAEDALEQAGLPVPNPVRIKGKIDRGVAGTAVGEDVPR